MALLEVKNLGISFGGLRAVNGFDISIEKEALYGLIGPNGAGKTTVFNLLTGVYKPDSGKVLLDGTDITGKNTIEINKAGIARTFQNIRLFKQLSVLDNVKVGLHNKHHYSTLSGVLRLPGYRKVEKEMDEQAMELLKVFNLEDVAHVAGIGLQLLDDGLDDHQLYGVLHAGHRDEGRIDGVVAFEGGGYVVREEDELRIGQVVEVGHLAVVAQHFAHLLALLAVPLALLGTTESGCKDQHYRQIE